jgi:hypothetical protein
VLKLYNIYREVILEQDGVKISTPTIADIMDVIKHHKFVDIWYDNEPNKRYCQVYNLGKTSNGYDAIRVWQSAGPGKRKTVGWKVFRIDKITGWQVKPEMKFRKPVDKTAGYTGAAYDPTGDKSLGWGNSVVTSNFNN